MSPYNVGSWESGALAAGSSGSPLLDASTGSLYGIFTETYGVGAYACFEPGLPADDWFTALSSILDFLPAAVDDNRSHMAAFDSYDYVPVAGTVATSSYYGDGEFANITASEQVFLVDGFFADKGSTIYIEVGP